VEELSPIREAEGNLEFAVFGGGCFWCIEAVFSELRGVERIDVGYAGGHTENPTYKQVCTGTTGHAEVVRIAFDPGTIGYRDLLLVFFHAHDPTTLNQQGPDKGTQYRSIVLYRDEFQKVTAQQAVAEIEAGRVWSNPVVTELAPLQVFTKAEESHRAYFARNPEKQYCQAVISPKILKMRKLFADRLKPPPA
jgi:peptide-methionine (S)-S-oxide reductase